MNNFFNQFETDILSNYKIYREDKRAEVEELLKQETEAKQQKLEAKALRKQEREQKLEEAKRLAEEARTGKPVKAPAKPAPAKGKGGKDDKPQLDVPHLEVPKVQIFKTEMGNQYIRERPLEEIITKIMTPADYKDEETPEEDPAVVIAVLNAQASAATSTKDSKTDVKAIGKKESIKDSVRKSDLTNFDAAVSPPAEEEKKEDSPKFQMNDYMEKAEKPVPEDPDGKETMHANLIVSFDRILNILQSTLEKNLTWLLAEKQNYAQKVQQEGKDLIDKSVEELDENLRKQWPRKGRLEVEVFQERKS